MIFQRQALYGVVGNPVKQSLSPLLFSLWKQQTPEVFSYFPFYVGEKQAESFFSRLKETGIQGINITKPYKEPAFSFAEELSESAKAIGAANILYYKKGKLRAENSDAEGFIRSLPKKIHTELKEKRVLVLGAGGAAKAILYALKKTGVRTLFLTARNQKKAEQTLKPFYDSKTDFWKVLPWEKRDQWQRKEKNKKQEPFLKKEFQPDFIINTTPCGLAGSEELSFNFSTISFPCFVFDLIYNPEKTQFLEKAEKQGLETQNGLKMLVEQARITYQLFFEKLPKDPENLIDSLEQRVSLMNSRNFV